MRRESKPSSRLKTTGLFIFITILFGLVGLISFLGYAFSSTPDIIKRPSAEHYHFRMQILVDGKPENFGSAEYQEAYSRANCNANLSSQPIHFHDNKDQIVHIHWEGITGGIVLKYYGWNKIGSPEDYLGYRFDKLPRLSKVPIHSYALPKIKSDSQFYIYAGDTNSYKKRNFNDFLNKDLERFLDRTSNFPGHKFRSSTFERLFPKTYAHNGNNDGHTESSAVTPDSNPTLATETPSNVDLTKLNNLIGNVVIFVQQEPPTDSQIKARFNSLEPLSTSVCGG